MHTHTFDTHYTHNSYSCRRSQRPMSISQQVRWMTETRLYHVLAHKSSVPCVLCLLFLTQYSPSVFTHSSADPSYIVPHCILKETTVQAWVQFGFFDKFDKVLVQPQTKTVARSAVHWLSLMRINDLPLTQCLTEKCTYQTIKNLNFRCKPEDNKYILAFPIYVQEFAFRP